MHKIVGSPRSSEVWPGMAAIEALFTANKSVRSLRRSAELFISSHVGRTIGKQESYDGASSRKSSRR
jgi:hypothetical protein